MKINLVNNSVVVVASSHNPSVVSNSFFQKTGIIKDFKDIVESNLIITPAVSQILFKSGTSLQLDPERLTLTSIGANEEAAYLADKYCETLPYIKGTAIGINVVYMVTDFQFDSWFNSMKTLPYRDASFYSLDFRFTTDDGIKCNAKVSMSGPTESNITFNFHRDLIGVTLGELGVSIVERRKSYLPIPQEFIETLLKS